MLLLLTGANNLSSTFLRILGLLDPAPQIGRVIPDAAIPNSHDCDTTVRCAGVQRSFADVQPPTGLPGRQEGGFDRVFVSLLHHGSQVLSQFQVRKPHLLSKSRAPFFQTGDPACGG
jgi:hypothetical protein